MLFDREAFLKFLWGEYDYSYMTEKYGHPYDDISPKEPDHGFEDWVEREFTKLQMVAHLCEFLAEWKECKTQ